MEKIKNIIRHPLFSGSAVMIGGSMIVNIINYIYHLVVGRMLGPVNYGILASLFSIVTIIGIVPTSTSVSIVKYISSSKNLDEVSAVYGSIYGFVLKLAFIASLIVLLISPVIASFLHIGDISLVALISPILFFSLITLVNQATSQGLLKFTGFVVPSLASTLIKICLGIGLVVLGFSVFGAMIGVLIGTVLSFFVSIPFIKNLKKNMKKYDLKPFFKFSIPVFFQALAFTSIFTMDVLLARHFLPPFEAGIYASLSILGKIVFFASSPIASVMFPVVSGRNTKGEPYQKIFWGAFALTFAVSFAIIVFYYLFADFAINILYGSAYLSAAPNLTLMGIFILLYTLDALLVNFALSLGETKIIIFPVVAAMLQAVLIWLFHSDIKEIILMSLIVCLFMFFGEAVYLRYNSLYAKS